MGYWGERSKESQGRLKPERENAAQGLDSRVPREWFGSPLGNVYEPCFLVPFSFELLLSPVESISIRQTAWRNDPAMVPLDPSNQAALIGCCCCWSCCSTTSRRSLWFFAADVDATVVDLPLWGNYFSAYSDFTTSSPNQTSEIF